MRLICDIAGSNIYVYKILNDNTRFGWTGEDARRFTI
jgi:hypothetical protein